MSHEDAKFKHSTRIHKDKSAEMRQVEIAVQHGEDKFEARNAPHRYAKKHAAYHKNHVPSTHHSRQLTAQEKRLYQEDEKHGYHAIDPEDSAVLNA